MKRLASFFSYDLELKVSQVLRISRVTIEEEDILACEMQQRFPRCRDFFAIERRCQRSHRDGHYQEQNSLQSL